MRYKKYNFLFLWGFLITVGSVEQLIRPASEIPLLVSPVFILVMLAAGILLMVSYFVINRSFQVGRRLAVIALLLNIAYFLFEFVLEAGWSSNPLWATILVCGLAMALLVGYTVFLCRKKV